MANSDYTKPHSNVYELLPSVYQSETSKTISRNLFDRFWSKNELKNVVGTITSHEVDRFQLPELDAHRQYHQLQPLLCNKIATNDYISSFQDILQESIHLGSDEHNVDRWLSAEQFNFSPPIDFDKLINFSNYYWMDDTQPQYITIANRFNKLSLIINHSIDVVDGLDKLSADYQVESDPIEKQLISDDMESLYPGFTLLLEEYLYNVRMQPENIVNMVGWDHVVNGIQILEHTNNTIMLQGNYVTILETLRGLSQSIQIVDGVNQGSYTMSDVTQYNASTNITTITIDQVLPAPEVVDSVVGVGTHDWVIGGMTIVNVPSDNQIVISGDYQQAADAIDRVTILGDEYEIAGVLYNDELNQTTITTQQSLSPSIQTGTVVRGIGTYDHKLVNNVMVDNPFGFAFQDNRWSAQNKWVHINQIGDNLNLNALTQAEQPIIEYESFLEMNEWAKQKYRWKYSADGITFRDVDVEPTNMEVLQGNYTYNIVEQISDHRIVINTSSEVERLYPDAEITLQSENQFSYFTVRSVEYNLSEFQATIELREPFVGTVANTVLQTIRYSSVGDDWRGFYTHWVYDGVGLPTPCEPQTISEAFNINSINHDETRYEDLRVASTKRNWYRLNKIQIQHFDDVRVYVNGERLYGTYQLGNYEQGEYRFGSPINAIWLFEPPTSGVIRVECGPAALIDESFRVVQLRTSVSNSNQIEEVGLTQFIKTEQNKLNLNQYPLFDMYNLDGTHSGLISPLWSFKENPEYPVNALLQRRIERDGTEYTYDQHLVDDNEQTTYAYKQHGSLRTVWRSDANNIQYKPKYVNSVGEQVAVGDPQGQWEIPQQMYSNLENENRKWLTSTQLLEHFRTVINNQPAPPGTDDVDPSRWILLDAPEYGAGGTIKQFNDGFDVWASSAFIKNINPIQLIEFAKQQYLECQRGIITTFVDKVDQMLLDSSSRRFQRVVDDLATETIRQHESNESFKKIFGDSTMFNGVDGVRNWVASLARFGMIAPTKPELLVDEQLGLVVLTHHDGHKSSPNITVEQRKRIVDRLLKAGVERGSLLQRPTVEHASRGQMFYATDTKTLYRNVVTDYSASTPSHADGVMWYNTSDNTLYKSHFGQFVAVTSSCGWIKIDLGALCAKILYAVEQQLYAACQDIEDQYPVDAIIHEPQFGPLGERSFWEHARREQVVSPLTNTQFQFSNPFSWNYKQVPLGEYNTSHIPSTWNSSPPTTWYVMYEDLYGTRFPHLQPWRLQSYDNKPSWWDREYLGVERRWSTRMWTNIIKGAVPKGYPYPDGVISSGGYFDSEYVVDEGLDHGLTSYDVIPVNQTDEYSTDGAYAPDDLLPPFFTSTELDDQNIVATGSLLTSTPNQNILAVDFEYGDRGPFEDSWQQSIHFLYDMAQNAFLVQPMRFMYHTFGGQLQMVDGVQVDTKTNTIPSHSNAIFHGDMVDDRVIVVDGLNQWYVNFTRFRDQTLDSSELRPMWTQWKVKLGYQVSSFVDPDSLVLRTDSNRLDTTDYELKMKHTTGYRSLEFNALRVTVSAAGSGTLRSGVRVPVEHGDDWKFRITTTNPTQLPIKLYGITPDVKSTFNVMDRSVTDTTWNHYHVDNQRVLSFDPGMSIESLGPEYLGVQGVINFIDGYAEYLKDQGFVFNDIEYSSIDPDTGRVEGWQLETERLIQQIYTGMATDRLPLHFVGKWSNITVDVSNNRLFSSMASFQDGEMIQFHSSGSLPSPLQPRVAYRVHNSQGNTFQLYQQDELIMLTSVGRGVITAGLHFVEATAPQSLFEVNPCREILVVNHEQGILSNIHRGAYPDVDYNNGLLDSNGRRINPNNVQVFRGDKTSVIRVRNNNQNISMGSFTGFVDAYEHVILFENTSLEQGLLFDPFLGVTINKLYINMRIGKHQNMRPNVGGRFLHNNQLKPNIESSIQDLQMMYDANGADEDSLLTQSGRSLLGFQTRNYLTEIGITPKSQFLFYRGMIHQKGSVNAIRAFINLRLFIDANVDEYWAYKVNDFGDARDRFAPELMLQPVDTYSNQLRIQFLTPDDNDPQPQHITVASDDLRWVDQPLQHRTSLQRGNYKFNGTVVTTQTVSGTDLQSSPYVKLDVACEHITVVVPQYNKRMVFNNILVQSGGWQRTFDEKLIAESPDAITARVQRGSNPTFYDVPSSYLRIDSDTNTMYISGYQDDDDRIRFLEDGDTVEIVTHNATLVADVHFSRYNGQLVHFNSQRPLQDFTSFEEIVVYGIRPDVNSVDPIKVVDTETYSTTDVITMWDPRYDRHYYNAIRIVDVQGSDPAIYTHNPTGDVDYANAWHRNNKDTVWLDTSITSYKPYNDVVLFPSIERRLEQWGRMEDWSELSTYQWIQSPVHPSEYVEYTEDHPDGVGGVPKQTLFKRVRDLTTNQFGEWVEVHPVAIKHIMPILDDNQLYDDSTIYSVSQYGVENGQTFYLYRNGELFQEGQVQNGQVDISFLFSDATSVYSIYIPLPEVDDDILEFDPMVEDDEDINIDYVYDYKYTREDREIVSGAGIDSTYYFWASDTNTDHQGTTIAAAKRDLQEIPEPYAVINNYVSDPEPAFSRVVIRGLVNRASSTDRYILRLNNNQTLRDRLTDSGSMLRNTHTQWKMFRERQKFNVDRWLWNKLTEACSGRTMDTHARVPSLDYQLYDEQQGTNCQYGLEAGQTMLDSQRAIDIVIEQINDPQYDLSPIDRNQFFETYSFDTAENVERAMQSIYEMFLPQHVNRIWFAVLYEALATNTQFNNIMKTSWIQLDGVRLLDRSGVLQ